MKKAKIVLRWFIYLMLIPLSYILISLLLTWVSVHEKINDENANQTIYISTNGVHLNIVMPKKTLGTELLKGIEHQENDSYLAFGWGDKDFYLETRNWEDLSIKRSLQALFLKTPSLMHITRYQQRRSDWVAVHVDRPALKELNTYLLASFKKDSDQQFIKLDDKGYTEFDDFYAANGSYSCLKTCNSWVNTAFKRSGLKACLWTPYEFGLLNKYE